MPITGSVVTQRTKNLVNNVATDAPPGSLSFEVIQPSGQVKIAQEEDISHDGVGKYSKAVLGDESGLWHYRWLIEGEVADEGDFEMESVFDEQPPDLTDLRVLVPKARRACEGPFGLPAGFPALTDDQVYAIVADACAEVQLLTGTLFGHELHVKRRDPLRGFPTAWNTNAILSESEGAVIVTQAAINFVYHLFREAKTSETIKDEGQEWTWDRSANLMVLQVKQLIEARDKALEMLERIHAPLDSYISSVAERDKIAAVYLEPWVTEVGAPVPYTGLSGATTGGFDFRFGTFG